MDSVIYLIASPLHLFVSLGLMCGPFRHHRHIVVLINRPSGQRDFLAEALESECERRASVSRFPVLGRCEPARKTLAEISNFVSRHAPAVIAVGCDEYLEFYAAVRGWPQAKRVFLEDGLYSYLPVRNPKPSWWQAISNWRRSLKYGVPVERPAYLGGSRAVQESYVFMPRWVHRELARKPVHRLEREWFADPWLRNICIAAAEAAGFDAQRCRSIGLLMLLPRLTLLQESTELRQRFERIAHAHAKRGGLIAIKRHPRARGTDFGLQLDLPSDQLIEIPPLLPSEALVPLLNAETLVVGARTTALLTLALLADQLRVRSVMSTSGETGATARFNEGALQIYQSVGIRTIEDDEIAALEQT
jgi:hypothetical protein